MKFKWYGEEMELSELDTDSIKEMLEECEMLDEDEDLQNDFRKELKKRGE